MKVIINADDCGFNERVNQHIKEAIEKGKITSTTIMAQMSDLDGALALYEQYNKEVSFGIHLNLTEGEPLLKSQYLLEFGYYSIKDDKIVFDGNKAESFRYKHLPNSVKIELYKELSAQIERLQNAGLHLSHLDSHHHIHTCLSLMDIMAQLSKEYGIYKMRRIRNYVPRSLNYYGRQLWAFTSRFANNKYLMTDFFAAFEEFFSQRRLSQLNAESTIELMIHPGSRSIKAQTEESMMYEMIYPRDIELISYNNLK